MSDFKVTTTQSISRKKIQGLLCGAFEGGSNYWYTQLDPVVKDGVRNVSNPGDEFSMDDFWHTREPLTAEGVNLLDKEDTQDGRSDGKQYNLNLTRIRLGLQIFATEYPRHFLDMMSENDDAITADVFLQCCIFGALVYG